MKNNKYHKPFGTHTPIVVKSVNDMTPAERFQLMFGQSPASPEEVRRKYEDKADIPFLR